MDKYDTLRFIYRLKDLEVELCTIDDFISTVANNYCCLSDTDLSNNIIRSDYQIENNILRVTFEIIKFSLRFSQSIVKVNEVELL